MKLRETVNVTSYTPPSPIKATPTSIGYGIFPPKNIQNSMENSSIEDWGINEYNTTGSTIRKYSK
jgi:hypothetical protein